MYLCCSAGVVGDTSTLLLTSTPKDSSTFPLLPLIVQHPDLDDVPISHVLRKLSDTPVLDYPSDGLQVREGAHICGRHEKQLAASQHPQLGRSTDCAPDVCTLSIFYRKVQALRLLQVLTRPEHLATVAALADTSSSADAVTRLFLLATNAAAQVEHLGVAPECACTAPHVGTVSETLGFAYDAMRLLNTYATVLYPCLHHGGSNGRAAAEGDGDSSAIGNEDDNTTSGLARLKCMTLLLSALETRSSLYLTHGDRGPTQSSPGPSAPPPLTADEALANKVVHVSMKLLGDLQAMAASKGLAWGHTASFYTVWARLLFLFCVSRETPDYPGERSTVHGWAWGTSWRPCLSR